MAVKTLLTDDELARVSEAWELDRIVSARGLPEGSVNTLYALETDRETFILRLSEGRREGEIAFETGLVEFLRSVRYPAVAIVPRPDGQLYGRVQERFATVFRKAAGQHVLPSQLSVEQAMESGRLMGRLHVLTEPFAGSLDNRYGPDPVRAMVAAVLERAQTKALESDEALQAAIPLLEREVARIERLPPAAGGVIHADWFPDNLCFVGDRISAVLDFEMACRGPYVLDIATAIHACCYLEDHAPALSAAFVRGYEGERKLSREERAAFHAWACFSALRFTASRILDFHLSPLSGERLVRKDWRRFRDRLSKTVAMGPRGWSALCGLSA